jgi:hypothetical protein
MPTTIRLSHLLEIEEGRDGSATSRTYAPQRPDRGGAEDAARTTVVAEGGSLAEKDPRVPPRWFVVSAWHVHRWIVRATRSRKGLWGPRAGKWGALRITTTVAEAVSHGA